MPRRLIDRDIHDTNFSHTLSLLGPAASWAESLEVGHKIERNDLNMIAIHVEIALAFARAHLNGQDHIAEGARKALDLLQAFRAAFSEDREAEKPAEAGEPDLFAERESA